MDGIYNSKDDTRRNDPKWIKHVTECPRGDDLIRYGDKAEMDVVWYLLNNLQPRVVGEFRILTNYHMPVRSSGPAQTQEIDVVLINKFGVFLLEVKNRSGKIVAFDSTWMQDGRDMKGNPLISIENKARIYKSHWFGKALDTDKVYVRGLVVLARGKASFENKSNYDDRSIVGIDEDLLRAVNPPSFLLKADHRNLSNDDIKLHNNTIFKKHTVSDEVLVEDYRLEKKILSGDFFTAYEARNVNIPTQQVRIKIYQSHLSKEHRDRFRRDADAVTKLGYHQNILFAIHFFPDEDRSGLYYEVTELIDGIRLDKLMSNRDSALPFETQINYLEQLCTALSHAHSQGIIHRNICPETIYITKKEIVKLADFDFAKVDGFATIVDPTIPLIDSEFTPPELYPDASNASPRSDLYALGCLWLYMASWPAKGLMFNNIDLLPISEHARKLMHNLLSHIPEKRPQSAEVLQAMLHDLKATENNS